MKNFSIFSLVFILACNWDVGLPGGGDVCPPSPRTIDPPAPSSTPYEIAPGTSLPSFPGFNITSTTNWVYTITWDGNGRNRTFSGAIVTERNFKDVTHEDDCVTVSISNKENRIDFGPIFTDMGSLSFQTDQTPVYFDLMIDGLRDPMLVTFPTRSAIKIGHPDDVPFYLKQAVLE